MIIDIVQNKAWALHEDKLKEVNAFLENRIADPKFHGEVKAAAQANNQEDKNYEVRDNIAIIPIIGVVSKRMNLLTSFSGGTSTELLKRDIQAALSEPSIQGIVLDIDCPGGSVDGTKELADFIFESRGKKTIIAYANGLMASAAYWFGSAADAIVASSTAMVGNIGVALTHYDESKRDAAEGIVKTEIFAGKYKRIAGSEKPLSDEGREYLQSRVDVFYSLFVDSVQKNRGISPEKALEISNGKDYIGKEALTAGLVDDIGNLDTALNLASQRRLSSMDINSLKTDHPELYAKVLSLGKTEATSDIDKGIEAARQEERTRTVGILEAGGDPKVTLEAIKTGASAGDTYKKFFEAEKGNKAAALNAMNEEAPDALDIEEPAASADKAVGFNAEVNKLIEAGSSRAAAVKAVAKSNPKLHQAYVEKLGG